jgi:hypothetical protein
LRWGIFTQALEAEEGNKGCKTLIEMIRIDMSVPVQAENRRISEVESENAGLSAAIKDPLDKLYQ